jgi:hypothetical protein
MTDYKIVEYGSSEGLEIEVNALLEQGFTLVGGVTFCMSDDSSWYMQAMARPEPSTAYLVLVGEMCNKGIDSVWSTEEAARRRISLLKGNIYGEPWPNPIQFEVDPA